MRAMMEKTKDIVSETIKNEVYERIELAKNPDYYESVAEGFKRIEKIIAARYGK
ncbi:MAG: hypothetical protein LBB07_02020 [Bifidobacteriaceae bacterium]|jgi:hypothetical protein|nr:hypothetical protein [Bifidobacteriaceae bacterium]